MNARKVFVVLTLLFCFSAMINAQEHKPISGGVLNGKAVSLPKPVYPQIARAARAGGTVVVNVTIDEEGNVISANAISGHPLLRAAAVQAAQGAKFSPTLLQGNPVKVTGTIVYNFVTEMSWIEIGKELGRGAKNSSYFMTGSIVSSLRAKQFHTESSELQELQSSILTENGRTEARQDVPSNAGGAVVVGIRAKSITKEEYSTKVNSIISSLETKLMSDMSASWYYSLGLIMGNVMESMKDDAEFSKNLERLRNHVFTAPSDISGEITSKLRQLSSYSDKSVFDEKEKADINRLLGEILNTPIQRF